MHTGSYSRQGECLLLPPKSYRGFVGFDMVGDVAVDNRAGGVAWRRGGGWVGEVYLRNIAALR